MSLPVDTLNITAVVLLYLSDVDQAATGLMCMFDEDQVIVDLATVELTGLVLIARDRVVNDNQSLLILLFSDI